MINPVFRRVTKRQRNSARLSLRRKRRFNMANAKSNLGHRKDIIQIKDTIEPLKNLFLGHWNVKYGDMNFNQFLSMLSRSKNESWRNALMYYITTGLYYMLPHRLLVAILGLDPDVSSLMTLEEVNSVPLFTMAQAMVPSEMAGLPATGYRTMNVFGGGGPSVALSDGSSAASGIASRAMPMVVDGNAATMPPPVYHQLQASPMEAERVREVQGEAQEMSRLGTLVRDSVDFVMGDGMQHWWSRAREYPMVTVTSLTRKFISSVVVW